MAKTGMLAKDKERLEQRVLARMVRLNTKVQGIVTGLVAGLTIFGAHTLTHPDLTCLPFDRVNAEICDSKAIIEDALSSPVSCFAYPYGRYDHRSHEIA